MLNLPKLQPVVAVVTSAGHPTVAFQTWWQSVVNTIEAHDRRQDEQLAAIEELQASQAQIIEDLEQTVATLQETVGRLDEAVAAIIAVQETADKVTLSNAISASYTAPSMVLTSVDAGADATVTVSDFTRKYDDGTSVAVTGASFTGLPYDTLYSVYYDDVTRQSTTPTLQITTVTSEARHNSAAGRHFVASVRTPFQGGAANNGGSTPPGGGAINDDGTVNDGSSLE